MPDETDRVSAARRALDEFLNRLARAVVAGLPAPDPSAPSSDAPVIPPISPPGGDDA